MKKDKTLRITWFPFGEPERTHTCPAPEPDAIPIMMGITIAGGCIVRIEEVEE